MNGLDLEPFLRLVRADLGVGASLAAILAILAAMAWTSWGSRRALRKCLVLSIVAHAGLLLYGYRNGLHPSRLQGGADEGDRERIQEIRVLPEMGTGGPASPGDGRSAIKNSADWDRPQGLMAGAEKPILPDRPAPPVAEIRRDAPEPLAVPTVSPPEIASPIPARPEEPERVAVDMSPPPVAPARPEELPAADLPPTKPTQAVGDLVRIRPKSASRDPSAEPSRPRIQPDATAHVPTPKSPEVATPVLADLPEVAEPATGASPDRESPSPKQVAEIPPDARPAATLPEPDLRARSRGGRPRAAGDEKRPTTGLTPLVVARANPSGAGRLPALPAPAASRPLPDIPEVYRPRLAPDRLVRALRSGATEESEQAVERALDWLAKHQDADGRWNGGTKKYANDAIVPGEANFTQHCPPGDLCSGECEYWEADSAMTGLALLAYLGAGSTHTAAGGPYAAVVDKGLQYLLSIQKADGDLRGESRAVGLYCHAMAGLALCEAYALSGDERLRDPVERAVGFLVRSRAADGLSWRYAPGAPSGDTSILGWVILAFKSAQEVGIAVPQTARLGALGWLNRVAEGPDKGLAVYRPGEGPYGGGADYRPGRNMTPTMTAEAWACRQFLGVGGPGPASDEAARYLLQHPPERATYDLYYWYYGTLALFQRGGPAWERWNARVRDELVGLQKSSGHEAGSWAPQDSRGKYDIKGGRIYCTALAALTLEVYYRYNRVPTTPKPKPTPNVAPAPDPTLRRARVR